MAETAVMFRPPSPEAVEHALREVEYGSHVTGFKMTPSAGNVRTNLYSLPEAVRFLLGTPWDAPMLASGFKGAINWMDLRKFAVWLRDVIGDVDLAEVVEERVLPLDPYYAQIKELSSVLAERMDQYRAVRGAAAAEHDKPAEVSGDSQE